MPVCKIYIVYYNLMVGAWLLMGNQAFRLDSPTFQCEVGEGKFYSVNE